MNKFDNNFYKARQHLIQSGELFYAILAQKCAVAETNKINTISVKEKDTVIFMTYNLKWVNATPVNIVAGAIKHALNHLIFGHLGDAFTIDDYNKLKMDYAKDLAINSMLDVDELPSDYVHPEPLNLPIGLSTREYFSLLPDFPPPPKAKGKEESNGGNNKNNEGDNKEQKHGDSHNDMTSNTSTKNITEDAIREMVKDALKKSGRLPSNMPSNMRAYIDDLIKAPEIPWQSILRRLIAFAKQAKKVKTKKRPNRRYGEDFPGTKKTYMLNIMVSLDESGSIGDEEWQQFMAEIEAMYNTKQCTIWLCKFTTEVKEYFQFFGKSKLKKIGRHYGGTLFQPFLDKAEETRPDILICLTDGYNYEEQIKYSKPKTIIWCLTPGVIPTSSVKSMGNIINIKKKEKDRSKYSW